MGRKELTENLDTYHGRTFTYPYEKMETSAKLTVLVALDCFLSPDGDGVIPVIEDAINRGGDTDAIAAIAGGITDAYYKEIESNKVYDILIDRLPEELSDIASNLV